MHPVRAMFPGRILLTEVSQRTTLPGYDLHATKAEMATTHQPHAIEALLSIDHIAVPEGVEVADVRRVSAAVDGRRLSDHDAYALRIVDLG